MKQLFLSYFFIITWIFSVHAVEVPGSSGQRRPSAQDLVARSSIPGSPVELLREQADGRGKEGIKMLEKEKQDEKYVHEYQEFNDEDARSNYKENLSDVAKKAMPWLAEFARSTACECVAKKTPYPQAATVALDAVTLAAWHSFSRGGFDKQVCEKVLEETVREEIRRQATNQVHMALDQTRERFSSIIPVKIASGLPISALSYYYKDEFVRIIFPLVASQLNEKLVNKVHDSPLLASRYKDIGTKAAGIALDAVSTLILHAYLEKKLDGAVFDKTFEGALVYLLTRKGGETDGWKTILARWSFNSLILPPLVQGAYGALKRSARNVLA
jgi:hypothetical protein